MCPKNASYYGNRAATLMMLCRYREALEDSQQAVRLDNTFMKVEWEDKSWYIFLSLLMLVLVTQLLMQFNVKVYLITIETKKTQLKFVHRDWTFLFFLCPQGHLREGKCHLSLGNAMAAGRCFQKVLELEPDNSQAQQEVSWQSAWSALPSIKCPVSKLGAAGY